MKLRSTLLAATAMAMPLAAPMGAHAQSSLVPNINLSGFYVSAGAGANWLLNEDINQLGFPGTKYQFGSSAQAKSNAGPVAVGAIGYLLPYGLAIELEGDYRNNSFAGAANTQFPANVGGHVRDLRPHGEPQVRPITYFASMGLPFPIAPYIGAGVGYQWNNFDNFRVTSYPGGIANFKTSGNTTQGAFAYQAIIGTILPIQTIPGLALTLEYRFMGQSERTIDGTASVGNVSQPATVKFGRSFNNAVLVGFRYTFGVTPPPPAPAPIAAPAPAPARSYLVFFDWDKATLTDRARQIISEAAQNSTHVQYTQIEVNGYTDTSGTPQYNMGLSIRRANAVAAELVRDGVPRNAISIHGFGETHLLVPTGPGVREPQNRRVEIIIR